MLKRVGDGCILNLCVLTGAFSAVVDERVLANILVMPRCGRPSESLTQKRGASPTACGSLPA